MKHLRARQLEDSKFVRPFPIGNAVADFACRNAKLMIETIRAELRNISDE